MSQLILGLLLGVLVGGALVGIAVWFILKPRTEEAYEQAKNETAEMRRAAEAEAQAIISAAQEESRQARLELENVTKQRYADLARAEERIDGRQDSLDRQGQRLEAREQMLNKRQSRLDKQANDLETLQAEHMAELQRIANMTTDEARQSLLEAVEAESRQDMARVIRESE
jgi:ribonuclease Y